MLRFSDRPPAAALGVLLAGLAVFVWGCRPSGAGEPVSTHQAGPRWQDDPIWNDGRAEVSVFRATESKYGVPREFRYVHVVVAENLRRDLMVKTDVADPPGGTLRVLKNNQQWDIPTGVYSYRQMASVFLDIEDLSPVKITVTSHELCGNTFHHLLAPPGARGPAVLKSFSYFEGEGDQSHAVDLDGVQAYDALPVSLRALPFRDGLVREMRLLASLVSSHARRPVVREVGVRVTDGGAVETGLGPVPSWRVDVTPRGGGAGEQLWFERARPNRLLRWEQSDGGSYLLRSSRRGKYWELNKPGDEEWLVTGSGGGP